MSDIRSQLSEKNQWSIPKYRYLELKNYCLQYHHWKAQYRAILMSINMSSTFINDKVCQTRPNITEEQTIKLAEYSIAMERIERISKAADESISRYIFRAVTENISYPTLRNLYDIPCGKNLYYDRYRKFFWLLDQERGI